MTLAVLVAPIAAFISVTLFVWSLFSPKRNEAAEKLRPYGYRVAQDPDNLSRPFSERVFVPMLERMGRVAGSVAPKQFQERAKDKLQEAGNPLTLNAYLAVRAGGMFGLPIVYLLFAQTIHAERSLSQLAMFLILGYLGGYLPRLWLSNKGDQRRKAIERALPDALDLIVVSMEAGLALDGAVSKVVEKTRGPLKDEFKRTLSEIQLGKARREAFKELGARTRVKDLITLVNAVVQADQMGVSMSQVMRTQADESRLKRRQRAEEKAHQAAVKMLFPLVLFILPTVMIVTVGPAALQIYRQFSAGLLG